MEKKWNEEESLQLISEMIAQAKFNMRREDGFSYLLIGYALVVVMLLDAVLMHVVTPAYQAHWVWLLAAPAIGYAFYRTSRGDREAAVRTHIDTIINKTWKGFMIALGVVFVLLFGFAQVLRNWQVMELITPMVLVLTGLAQYVTAVACRYKPFYWGAVIFWVGALVCLGYCAWMREGSGQYVISAICIAGGFIVPGHLLNNKAEQLR